MKVGEELVNLKNITAPLLNMIADHDDVVHPNASKPLPEFVGSEDKRNLHFPTGHIGAAVSTPALKEIMARNRQVAQRSRLVARDTTGGFRRMRDEIPRAPRDRWLT